jgi:hypothetical protein
MNVGRQKEILSFFAEGDEYAGVKVQDKNFSKEELLELNNIEYITCTDIKPLRYTITIKGYRFLRGT